MDSSNEKQISWFQEERSGFFLTWVTDLYPQTQVETGEPSSAFLLPLSLLGPAGEKEADLTGKKGRIPVLPLQAGVSPRWCWRKKGESFSEPQRQVPVEGATAPSSQHQLSPRRPERYPCARTLVGPAECGLPSVLRGQKQQLAAQSPGGPEVSGQAVQAQPRP